MGGKKLKKVPSFESCFLQELPGEQSKSNDEGPWIFISFRPSRPHGRARSRVMNSLFKIVSLGRWWWFDNVIMPVDKYFRPSPVPCPTDQQFTYRKLSAIIFHGTWLSCVAEGAEICWPSIRCSRNGSWSDLLMHFLFKLNRSIENICGTTFQ